MSKSRRKSGVRRAELLAGIDLGRYAEALAAVDTEPETPDDLDDALLRAEVALYLDRFDEVASYLDRLRAVEMWLDADDQDGARARRARAIRVELANITGDQSEADRLVRPLLAGAIRAGDETAELRATYDAGRIARRRADWDLAVDRLERALELATRIGNRFYEGRVSFVLGVCRYGQNRVDLALPLLRDAARLLTETEDLRFRATVESFLGCLLSDLGDAKSGLALVDRAETTAVELGIVSDAVTARMNAARTRLALGRYEEAESALVSLLEWERAVGRPALEMATLRLLAIAQCVRGRTDDARRSATEALRLAEIAGNSEDRLEAELLVARADAIAGKPVAEDTLAALVVRANEEGTPYVQAEARIYLARALVATDLTRAKALCDEARAFSVVDDFFWLRREIEMVEADLRAMPVSVTEDGRLVMDARLGWPDLRAAREATERYWFERALAETGGNVSAVGRLLGLTRNEVHYLYRLVVKGAPARPSRRKDPSAPASMTRRRPPARRK